MLTNALAVETLLFFNVIRQADGIADSAKDRAKHFIAFAYLLCSCLCLFATTYLPASCSHLHHGLWPCRMH